MHLQLLLSAGRLLSITLGTPGNQGVIIWGVQSTGAPIAATTPGFIGELHIPNGRTLANSLLSNILPAGVIVDTALGRTFSPEGITPKLHCNKAP